jgi:periplasmic protein TonB
MRDKGAWYKDEWRKKVERIGNLNYPDEARRQQIYGKLAPAGVDQPRRLPV